MWWTLLLTSIGIIFAAWNDVIDFDFYFLGVGLFTASLAIIGINFHQNRQTKMVKNLLAVQSSQISKIETQSRRTRQNRESSLSRDSIKSIEIIVDDLKSSVNDLSNQMIGNHAQLADVIDEKFSRLNDRIIGSVGPISSGLQTAIDMPSDEFGAPVHENGHSDEVDQIGFSIHKTVVNYRHEYVEVTNTTGEIRVSNKMEVEGSSDSSVSVRHAFDDETLVDLTFTQIDGDSVAIGCDVLAVDGSRISGIEGVDCNLVSLDEKVNRIGESDSLGHLDLGTFVNGAYVLTADPNHRISLIILKSKDKSEVVSRRQKQKKRRRN